MSIHRWKLLKYIYTVFYSDFKDTNVGELVYLVNSHRYVPLFNSESHPCTICMNRWRWSHGFPAENLAWLVLWVCQCAPYALPVGRVLYSYGRSWVWSWWVLLAYYSRGKASAPFLSRALGFVLQDFYYNATLKAPRKREYGEVTRLATCRFTNKIHSSLSSCDVHNVPMCKYL